MISEGVVGRQSKPNHTYRLMAQDRPFRFAVQAHSAGSAHEWRETARSTEAMGYAALYLPDHFSDLPGPIAALMAAADATTRLRGGSVVFVNDYRTRLCLRKRLRPSTFCPKGGSTSDLAPAG